LANALALRLKRLEAIRIAAGRLMERPQLGRDVFERGAPEPIHEIKRPQWSATLYDLLSAYARERQKHALARVRLTTRKVWSLAEARASLERLIEGASDWTAIDQYLIRYVVEPSMRATVFASSLAATLEMAREGQLELHQDAAFGPLYIRRRGQSPDEPTG
jgi:segregation and condensation protein A